MLRKGSSTEEDQDHDGEGSSDDAHPFARITSGLEYAKHASTMSRLISFNNFNLTGYYYPVHGGFIYTMDELLYLYMSLVFIMVLSILGCYLVYCLGVIGRFDMATSSAAMLCSFIAAGIMSKEEADLVQRSMTGKKIPDLPSECYDEILSILVQVRIDAWGS